MKNARLFSKILTLISLISVLAFAAALAGCTPFEGYDDAAAIVKGNSFSTLKSVSSQSAEKFTLRCERCNGVKRIKNITVPENPVFDLTLKTESGRFKAVLVKDGEVFIICEESAEAPVSVQLAAGKYSLRIIAEDAEVEFTFNFNSYT